MKENNVSNACMPPSPVVTRWNTWFAAVEYHAKNHIDHYASFVEKEIEHCTTLQLRKAAELLHGDKLAMLRVELEFVAVHCEYLVSTLTSLETHCFMAVHVYNKMTDLLSWLQSPQIPYAPSNCQDATQNAVDKLADYVTGDKQPAIKLFQSVRVFDPRQLPLLSKTFHDHSQVVPGLMAAAEEWQTYLDVAERETIDENISLSAFWIAVWDRLPRLSALIKAYISLPVSSADVERSFSKHESMLSPLRCALSQQSLRAYCVVFYKNNM